MQEPGARRFFDVGITVYAEFRKNTLKPDDMCNAGDVLCIAILLASPGPALSLLHHITVSTI